MAVGNNGTIEFTASIEKVQTMANDGAIRVYIDMPETALAEMAQLVAFRVRGTAVKVTMEPLNWSKGYER